MILKNFNTLNSDTIKSELSKSDRKKPVSSDSSPQSLVSRSPHKSPYGHQPHRM